MRCNLMIEHLKTSIDKHKYAFRPNKRKSALPKRNSIDGDYLLSSEFLMFCTLRNASVDTNSQILQSSP